MPPIQLGYRGLGEFIVGLSFGPLAVLGSYFVQTGSFSLVSLAASIPIGILIALVLLINEFHDYEADKKVHKKTLVVILGKEYAVKIYHLLLALAYVLVLFFSLIKIIPSWCLIVLTTLPLAFKAYRVSRKNYDKIKELLPANAATIALHLFFGLLLSAGFVIGKIY